MAEKKGKGKIEGLNETLYSRTGYKNPLDKRTKVKEVELPDVEEKWQTPELDEMLKHERVPKVVNPIMKKIFLFALIFFIAAIGLAVYVFLGGSSFVSSKNLDVSVLGPATISAGEVLELGVSISNTNNADLELANLTIQYPQGSRSADDASESLTYTKENLGVMKAGSEVARNIRLIPFGSEGDVKEIKFSVEYKVRGSNATFYKDKIFQITIGDAPISLTVDSPTSITSGESFTTVVSVTLNSTEVMKDVILKAEYPYGYSVIGTTPASAANDNAWFLGDLSPGDEKKVTIRGRLLGENQEERTFRFYVGVSDSPGASSNLNIVIASMLDTIAISRPSISLDVLFNGEDESTYIAPAARMISTSVRFQNNLPDKLLNPHLEVTLAGPVLDKDSVDALDNDGFYDADNSRIIWDLVNSQGNPELGPGENGQVNLRFSSLPDVTLSGGNSDIVLNFSFSGIPIGSLGQNPVTVNETRTVKISSQVNFSSKVLHSLGSFANFGPIPPKVGEGTSYTVVWSVGNTSGDLTDAVVTARLGPGVIWLGSHGIAGEDISYASSTNTVTWNMGMLPSESGFSTATREADFQISLTPTIGQVGMAPTLVNGIIFSGRDNNSGNTVTLGNSPLTTRLTADPAFIQGDDIVVK